MIQQTTDRVSFAYVIIQRATIPIIVLALFIPYFDTFSRLVKGWFSYKEAHKAILLAISFYLLWLNRDGLRQLNIEPARKIGSLVTLVGCLVLVGGALSNTSLIRDVSLPITLLGLIMLLGGGEYAKLTWLPVAYLLFVFEFFDELLGGIAIYLQYAAAWIAFVTLELSGMPVIMSAERLLLPHIVLDVGRGCSGINHIVALIALAIPFAFSRHLSSFARLSLIISALLIGVFVNGLRIAMIGLWSAENPSDVHGPHDIFYVSSIFFFGMALFFVVGLLFERFWPVRRNSEVLKQKSIEKTVSIQSELSSRIVSLSIGVLILCGTWVALRLFEPVAVPLARSISSFPMQIGEWSGKNIHSDDSPLKPVDADALLYRVYSDQAGSQAKLNIAYFELQDDSKKIVSYKTGWLYDNRMEMLPVATDEGTIHVARTVSRMKQDEPEAVYFWFDINGYVTGNRYAAKIRTIIDAATTRRTNGAIVRLSFPSSVNRSKEQAFLSDSVPVIRNFLKQKQNSI
jgi:EpsI family protein